MTTAPDVAPALVRRRRQPVAGALRGAVTGRGTTRLRRTPVPLREPRPVQRVLDGGRRSRVPETQGTLALDVPIPVEPDPSPAAVGRAVPVEEMPEPREWALTFAQAATEVAAGMRAPTQLVRWTTLDVHAMLARRGGLAARMRRAGRYPIGPPQVRTLRMFRPAAGVYEVSAVVGDQDRVRALAFRMEGFGERWRVTALETT